MKAYKFRIYPNVEQIQLLNKHFGCVRHVFNWALEQKERTYHQSQKSLSQSELQKRLVESKKQDKMWLTEVNSQSLLAALLNLDKAFSNFFKGRAKFPKFKKKYASTQSFQCPQHVKVDFESGLLYLPKFKTGIKAKYHRHFEGEIKTVTIKRNPSGKYAASILVDDHKEVVQSAPVVEEETLGIDLGLTHFLIDSQGHKVENPHLLKSALKKLGVAQKQLSRKVKGSKSHQRQKLKVALIHEKVRNSRIDFVHKVSAELVNKNHATSFALEDLHIKGMIKNRKLSRAIADVGWSKFIELLSYKCAWNGKNVLKIGRFEASSKVCNPCEYRLENLPLRVRHWDCPACGAMLDRDINAAKNIKKIAMVAERSRSITDALGHSVCIKSSPETKPFSDGVSARGAGNRQHGSQEAPTIVTKHSRSTAALTV